MKQIVRFRFLTIPNKFVGDIRITIEDRFPEYGTVFEGGKSTNVSIYPIINLQMLTPPSIDSNGNKIRGGWNIDSSIALTKFNLPIFIHELEDMEEKLKTPDLYVYTGKRLEINKKIASDIRRVFILGNTTIEITAVLLENENTEKLEGIKLKFNNEHSSVLFTLNELRSLIWQLNNIDVSHLALRLYLTYVGRLKKTPDNGFVKNSDSKLVDIPPLEVK